jgi:antitoxin FitA
MTPLCPAALPPRDCSVHADRRTSCWPSDTAFLGCLTFELSGRQRQDARARAEKMYRVPQTGPWWPAVGAPLERGVRPQCGRGLDVKVFRNQNETFDMVLPMPTTMTLKGIPDEVYAQLRTSAEVNRRSLNSEAIACLESTLLPRKATALEHVARAREVRLSLKGKTFKPEDIDKFKRVGRA